MKYTLSKSMVLITIILMDMLAGMEFDLFVPSFPALESHFHLTPFLVEALLSINLIGYCCSLFVVGSLADHYGRKPIIIGGFLIFILGSSFCLEAPSYAWLFLGRLLQGIGVAAPAILSFLLIADFYPLKKQQSLFALLNGVTSISVALAPVVGSYIALYFNWQGNFMALLLAGFFILILTLFFIPAYSLPKQKDALSWRGYLPLFKSKTLLLLMVNIIFMFVPYWIFAGIAPLLYIQNLGVSLAHFGYYQGSLALVFALGSLLLGVMIHRYDQKKMLYLSSYISVASLLSIGLVTFFNTANPLLITLSFIPFIVSQIIPSTLLYPLCVNFIPESKGRISAMLQGVRLIFSALGLQLVGYVYRGSFQNMGMIVTGSILIAVVTFFFVLRNKNIMNSFEK